MNPSQDGALFDIFKELLRKIVNSWKEWLNAKKKILQLKERQTTDGSLNLRDKLNAYADKNYFIACYLWYSMAMSM